MTAKRGISRAAVAFAIFGLIGNPAAAQKSGGILRQYIIDSPASMSIHEETTVVAERPMMGVFNNLVIFDQHVAQNSLAAVRPELATGWTWDEEGTRLDGQQYLQRLAHGGCLARSIAKHIRGRHTVADIHRVTPREASVRRQEGSSTRRRTRVARECQFSKNIRYYRASRAAGAALVVPTFVGFLREAGKLAG